MPVKLRLSRQGRKKAPFYHIVVADSRAPRDGKFIQKIGSYNPMTKPATIDLDRDAAFDWLNKGAQPTDTVSAILRFKGVYYKQHLMRGVRKGALTEDQAQEMLTKWIDAKEAKIAARVKQTMDELASFRKMVSGEAKPKVVVADKVSEEAAENYRVSNDEATNVAEEAATEAVEAVADVVEEVAPVTVEAVADVVEEVATEEVVEVVSENVETATEEPTADAADEEVKSEE